MTPFELTDGWSILGTTDIDWARFNFPEDFQKYVKEKKLYCHFNNRCDYRRWIFYSLEDDQREIPRGSFCDIQINTTMLELPFKTPIANPDITQKLISLFQRLPLIWWTGCLIQFWKAIETGGRRLLTTRDQPFYLNKAHKGLCSYRMMSLGYEFYVDGEGEENLGLPGRVFRYQRLESTPDVCYYSCKEYPQLDDAIQCKIKESLALPVFEPSTCNCVGVLELVGPQTGGAFLLWAFKTDISLNLEKVNLKSSGDCEHLYKLIEDEDRALEEELDNVMNVVCRTPYLPLVQIWAPCKLCNALVVHPSFSMDQTKSHFLNACEQHLEKGQGVVGRAFSSHNFVFCKDVTQLSIADYPLAPYARADGLTSCFAICLQSSFTRDRDDVYVMEIFLSPNMEGRDLKTTLISLLATMRQHLHSFKVASEEELGDDLSIEVVEFSKDHKLDSFQTPHTSRSPDEPKNLENGEETVQLDSSYQPVMEVDVVCTGNNDDSIREKSNIAITCSQQKCVISSSQRRARKSGIPISLENIKQCFGMKLGVAAERLGVGRSTLKRACREYDITWWPSCKRNKDNHFLSNKSVQGATPEEFPNSSQRPISYPLRKQDISTTATGTKRHSKAEKDTSNVTVKAKYGDDFIKFQLCMSSGMVEFQQQVAKRLNLKGGTYNVKYQDDDNDWILIACDEDLQGYIFYSRSLGRNTVTVSLHPITNCLF